ncbi:MAG TPA: hypothetical protein ENJ13_10380 [Chromatiales bacterium]|nr:hypothetical protein [Chromatiales bacterium]
MNINHSLHAISIKPPFYHDGPDAAIHRYLDAEFINRFQQDMQQQRFTLPQFSSWMQEDKHSPYDNKPVLRLPLHRAFHLVCCEVVCDQLGKPALDPQRITSAGFVIRRINGKQEYAWQLEDGEALGWQPAPTELRDPDIHRRLCANGVLQKRTIQPIYSGEEVFPLHTLDARDETGKRHTLLFGYVPLGGFYYHRDTGVAFDALSQKAVVDADAQSLSWPFGYRKPFKRAWNDTIARPVNAGKPDQPFFELLRLLVNRYHLGDEAIESNSALAKKMDQLWFYDENAFSAQLKKTGYRESSRMLFTAYRKSSVWSYLRGCFAQRGENPLVRWIIEQEAAIDKAGGIDKLSSFSVLPASSGKKNLNWTLFISESDAEDIRELLGQRLREQALAKVQEIPLPKFTQDSEDTYQIIPFVRSLNDQGKEQIQWVENTNRSILFRVAAPFDPEASRPSLIQMPSLSDLKRGMAKGASFITPPDTFNLINNLKLKKGAGEGVLPDSEPGPGLGIQWVCSFSLPVITLVAMILLMIMISLLNIIFFWLPWVKSCIPFPKINKGS